MRQVTQNIFEQRRDENPTVYKIGNEYNFETRKYKNVKGHVKNGKMQTYAKKGSQ